MAAGKRCFVLSLLAVLVVASLGAEVNAKDSIDYQKTADGAQWGWHEEMAGPLGCISQCGDKYDVRLFSSKTDRHSLSIKILSGDQEAYTWQGHPYSVFRILDDRLYYAQFHPSSSGGSIVAVDLTTGKELWKSPLKALGCISHSAYRTLLNLDCSRDVVTVYGNESMGKYFEVKRTDTGETVGHRLFDKVETDNLLLSVRGAMDEFFAACERGDIERVKQLAATGLDVRTRHTDVFYDHRCRGALHYAAVKGHGDTIQYLLQSGCDPNAKDKEGVSPLHLAVCGEKAVEALLVGKADPNAKDDSGRTPLHYAAKQSASDAAQTLLQRGAKVDATDNVGCTPLHLAAEYGATEVVEVLLKAGAQPSAKNTHGETPLDWARSRKNADIVQKLQKAVEQSAAPLPRDPQPGHSEGER